MNLVILLKFSWVILCRGLQKKSQSLIIASITSPERFVVSEISYFTDATYEFKGGWGRGEDRRTRRVGKETKDAKKKGYKT